MAAPASAAGAFSGALVFKNSASRAARFECENGPDRAKVDWLTPVGRRCRGHLSRSPPAVSFAYRIMQMSWPPPPPTALHHPPPPEIRRRRDGNSVTKKKRKKRETKPRPSQFDETMNHCRPRSFLLFCKRRKWILLEPNLNLSYRFRSNLVAP